MIDAGVTSYDFGIGKRDRTHHYSERVSPEAAQVSVAICARHVHNQGNMLDILGEVSVALKRVEGRALQHRMFVQFAELEVPVPRSSCPKSGFASKCSV
jgi:hypothetical protein